MGFVIQQVTLVDDLSSVCSQMQPDKWGEDNHMTSYRPEHLRKFLESGGILLLAKDGSKIAGVIIAYKLLHPAGEDSLYVHELDTHPDYRHQGVATLLVNKCKALAQEQQLTEVWVGTETDNTAANAFYKTLNPYEAEASIIYGYRVQ